jgi:hypothetical protein
MLIIMDEVKELCIFSASLLAFLTRERDNVFPCPFSVISCSYL